MRSRITIDDQELMLAPPPDHSCYSCSHFHEARSPSLFEHQPLSTPGNRSSYCEKTNAHNLHTWPFAHTICKKWEHYCTQQVEDAAHSRDVT